MDIFKSAKSGNEKAVKDLIYSGIDINAKNKDGITALMEAALEGRSNIIKILLEVGADLNILTANGNSALILAAREGNADSVQTLIDAGADLNIVNKEGKTAIELAWFEGYTDIAKLLKDSGAYENYKESKIANDRQEDKDYDITQYAFLNKIDVPSKQMWQDNINILGYNLILDSELKPFESSGFSPCKFNEKNSGFEIFYEDSKNVLEKYPNFKNKINNKDYCITFKWGEDLTEK